jgi:hypothetical protein
MTWFEIIKEGRCTRATKKTSSTRKGKKWMKCVPNGKGGYKRGKSFRARHNCSSCKAGDYSARCMACRDW